MPLPDDFGEQSLYTSDHWYVHDLLELDAASGRVVALTDTTRLGPMVEGQKPWPGQPKHVPGTVMIQITGTLGNLHAVYVLGLRMTDGWVGFGVGIDEARFRGVGRIGPPLRVMAEADRVRRMKERFFVRYRFEFQQEDSVIYESTQSAVWHRGE
jgi:hypothetical protein